MSKYSEEDVRRWLVLPNMDSAIQAQLYQWLSFLGFLVKKGATKANLLPIANRVISAKGPSELAVIHSELRAASSKLYEKYNNRMDQDLGQEVWGMIQRLRGSEPSAVRAPSPPRRIVVEEEIPLTVKESNAYQLISNQVTLHRPDEEIVGSCSAYRTIKIQDMEGIIEKKNLGAVDTHKVNKTDLCNIILSEVKVAQSDEPANKKKVLKEHLVQLLKNNNEPQFDSLCSDKYKLDGIKMVYEKAGGGGDLGTNKPHACIVLKQQIKSFLANPSSAPSAFASSSAFAPSSVSSLSEENPGFVPSANTSFWSRPSRVVSVEDEPPYAQAAPKPSRVVSVEDEPPYAQAAPKPSRVVSVEDEPPYAQAAPRPSLIIDIDDEPRPSCGNLLEEDSRCLDTEMCEVRDILDPNSNQCVSKTRTFTFGSSTYTGPRQEMNKLEEALKKRVLQKRSVFVEEEPRAPKRVVVEEPISPRLSSKPAQSASPRIAPFSLGQPSSPLFSSKPAQAASLPFSLAQPAPSALDSDSEEEEEEKVKSVINLSRPAPRKINVDLEEAKYSVEPIQDSEEYRKKSEALAAVLHAKEENEKKLEKADMLAKAERVKVERERRQNVKKNQLSKIQQLQETARVSREARRETIRVKYEAQRAQISSDRKKARLAAIQRLEAAKRVGMEKGEALRKQKEAIRIRIQLEREALRKEKETLEREREELAREELARGKLAQEKLEQEEEQAKQEELLRLKARQEMIRKFEEALTIQASVLSDSLISEVILEQKQVDFTSNVNQGVSETRTFTFGPNTYTGPRQEMNKLEESLKKMELQKEKVFAEEVDEALLQQAVEESLVPIEEVKSSLISYQPSERQLVVREEQKEEEYARVDLPIDSTLFQKTNVEWNIERCLGLMTD